jgi:lysophospholipase L1-like esterase
MRTGKQPTYKQWRKLLAREATVVAAGQGDNQLNILLGDSLSLWFPSDRLPQHQFWLNQSLSGDTTSDILRRLSAFAKTRPHVIYLMAGINDLKHGASDDQILGNLRRIINQLQLTHPQARIVLQSILPTRSMRFSNERIGQLNQQLEAIAEQNNISYLDLYSKMMDFEGNLHPALTTDGLHLNAKGYETWQWALLQTESQIAAREQG